METVVGEFLHAISTLSTREAEAETGINYGTIARLRGGSWKTIYPSTQREMESYLVKRRQARRSDEETPEDAVAESPVDEWAREFERRVRNVGGKVEGISEYERRARMSDAIEAQIQALQMIGDPVPTRLYELREMLKRGEI